MEYLERMLFKEVKKWMDRREIIAITGPRQSGKTTLLEMLGEWLVSEKGAERKTVIAISFEDREALENFSADPKSFVKRFISGNRRHYFLVDEAHYCENLGQKLKLLYDTFKNAKFVVTGSSSLELKSQTAKFLVGRVFSFELLPFNFYEFLLAKDRTLAKVYREKSEAVRNFIYHGKDFKTSGKDIFVKELLEYVNEYAVFGGYPEVVKAATAEEKRMVLKGIFNTYIEKDIIAFLQITDTMKFRKLVAMLASMAGGMLSYEKLASHCNSYFKEILRFLDILQQTYVIKLLRPFHRNMVTELRKNPKAYFYDTGLRNYAISNFNDLELREDRGQLAENFALNQIGNEEMKVNFWRTTAKAEVDFVLSAADSAIPVEAKFERMKEAAITRSYRSFLDSYGPERGLVVTKDFWQEKKFGKTRVKFVPITYL